MKPADDNEQLAMPDGTTFAVIESASSNEDARIVLEITMAPGAMERREQLPRRRWRVCASSGKQVRRGSWRSTCSSPEAGHRSSGIDGHRRADGLALRALASARMRAPERWSATRPLRTTWERGDAVTRTLASPERCGSWRDPLGALGRRPLRARRRGRRRRSFVAQPATTAWSARRCPRRLRWLRGRRSLDAPGHPGQPWARGAEADRRDRGVTAAASAVIQGLLDDLEAVAVLVADGEPGRRNSSPRSTPRACGSGSRPRPRSWSRRRSRRRSARPHA